MSYVFVCVDFISWKIPRNDCIFFWKIKESKKHTNKTGKKTTAFELVCSSCYWTILFRNTSSLIRSYLNSLCFAECDTIIGMMMIVGKQHICIWWFDVVHLLLSLCQCCVALCMAFFLRATFVTISFVVMCITNKVVSIFCVAHFRVQNLWRKHVCDDGRGYWQSKRANALSASMWMCVYMREKDKHGNSAFYTVASLKISRQHNLIYLSYFVIFSLGHCSNGIVSEYLFHSIFLARVANDKKTICEMYSITNTHSNTHTILFSSQVASATPFNGILS